MILGIDATNIRNGGGLTHLKEVISHMASNELEFTKVVIWSSNQTLSQISNQNWLIKESHPLLNRNFVWSFFYQILFLSICAKYKHKCDIVFVPGGTFLGSFRKIVSMSQNMLPFEKEEISRFKSYQDRLKYKFLKYVQLWTFKKSVGVIFLTNYAKDSITKLIDMSNIDSVIIPHGVNVSFLSYPSVQSDIDDFSTENPYKLLYVSIVTEYKHQWNVAEAVLKLRQEGYPITLELIGLSTEHALKWLHEVLVTDKYNCIVYRGVIPYEKLGEIYKNAQAFVFASTCENMPIILIEAMSAGLPIASSNFGPMPEVLGNAAFYFDPLKVDEIYNAIKIMLDSKDERERHALMSYNMAKDYTWKDCSRRTLEFLSIMARTNK